MQQPQAQGPDAATEIQQLTAGNGFLQSQGVSDVIRTGKMPGCELEQMSGADGVFIKEVASSHETLRDEDLPGLQCCWACGCSDPPWTAADSSPNGDGQQIHPGGTETHQAAAAWKAAAYPDDKRRQLRGALKGASLDC